jgi:hypothetical protein
MNLISRIVTLLILVSATIYFSACDGGGDNKKSEKEVQIDKLVGTWKVTPGGSVTSEDQGDVTSDYASFEIAITKESAEAMSFTTTGRPAKLTPWPPNGTLTFGTPVASKLIRGDGNVQISYVVSGNNLTLTLDDYSGTGYNGRTEGVAGDWTFNLTK